MGSSGQIMEFSIRQLLSTESIVLRDVVCRGKCRHKSAEEWAEATHLVFPYRGVYMRHVGSSESVAEANQVLLFNQGEGYRISHPVDGGDACLSLAIGEPLLRELMPEEQMRDTTELAFREQRLRIDARTQALVALIRYKLTSNLVETLEAESLTLSLLRRALGGRKPRGRRASVGRQKLVDRAKLVLSSDLGRRWTLAEIAGEVGVSPVYLTQVFQIVEGMPLYRYQLHLRLARALNLLGDFDDLTSLGMHLGFSSHSHFSSAFRKTYGATPVAFQRSAHLR